MKKIRATILSAFVLSALCVSGATLSHVQFFPASAQAIPPVAELIAPTSYEQYLRLNEPSAVAATENYTAIADGSTLYVYDRESEKYLIYDGHTKKIEKLQFDESGNLYFLSSLNVYRLPLATLKNGTAVAEKLSDVSCTGFLIHGESLFYTTVDEICVYSLADGSSDTLVTENREIENALAYASDGVLYYLCESMQTPGRHTMYAVDPQTKGVTPVTEFSVAIRSMTIANNLFCLTTKNGVFITYNRTELTASDLADDVTPITKEENGYVTLCAYGGNVYAVRGNAVRRYSVAEAAFTDFEISAASASPHRFNGASELLLTEDRLFIADDGNERISVYDTKTQAFGTPIVSTMPTPYLASYENTLLVSSSSEAVLYSLSSKSYGEELLKMEDGEIAGNIIGATSVYGRYYLLTDDNHCYALSAENGTWSWEKSQKKLTTFATAFASDVYGSLYVAYDNDTVRRFTEKELFSTEASGVEILTGLHDPEKIAVDYETNLYALSNGELTKYTKNNGDMYALSASYTPSYGLVMDDAPLVTSFAFGVESAYTYLLYEGDYVVRSDELQLPKVNPIPVGNATELIFGEGNADFSVVTVAADSVLIEFDVSKLQEATEFPYVAFERTQDAQSALKLGEESGYSILSLQDTRTGKHKTYLALNSYCSPLERTEYRTDYAEEKTGYLTSAVSVYKFPYLHELLTVASFESGMQVTLVGEVVKLDHAYYQITFETENGETKTGFIPKAYITPFDGSTPIPETVVSGSTETNNDAVWRVTYLILGFGAIAILVDFLILRKPKDTDA